MKYLLLLFLYTTSSFLFAQNSLLWKISGNGLRDASYLYGTYHEVCPQHFNPSEATYSALEKVQRLVFEVHMDSLLTQLYDTLPNPKQQLLEFNPKHEANTIQRLLSVEQQQQLLSRLNQNSLYKVSTLNRATLNQLINRIDFRTRTCTIFDLISYEQSLLELPEAQNKPQSGLAEPAEHFAYFKYLQRDVPQTVHAALQMLYHEKALRKAYKIEEHYFITGQIDQMQKNKFARLLEHPKIVHTLEEVIISKRNMIWLPRMEVHMRQQPTFFAVGAAHLGGDLGLIRLLRKRGYTVNADL